MLTDTIPLFPLHSVLFPGGPLPIRVFEPRYLDMVSRCLKDETEFGVIMILSGSEIGEAKTATVGTLARVMDWYQGSDGILGVTAVGVRRFKLNSTKRQGDGLYIGDVEYIASESRVRLPIEYRSMASLLEVVLDDLGKLYENIEKNYDDAAWVGRRFAEVLPISKEQRQHCLELDDPIERLIFLRPLLRSIRAETSQ